MSTSCILICILVAAIDFGEPSIPIETYKLKRKLFRYSNSFDSRIRPNDTAVVRFGLYIYNFKVDEANGLVTVQGHAEFLWNVPFLEWNPDDYGGVKLVRIDKYRIWTPDIVPFNGKAGDKSHSKFSYSHSVMVSNTGLVMWYYPTEIPFYCSIDHTNYPLDDQKCELIMGSWLYMGNELDLQPTNFDGNSANTLSINHPNWILKNVTTKRTHFDKYDYIDITFTLWLKRRFSLYEATLITPLGVAAFLALLIFWIPAWHPRKLSTGCVAIFLLVALLIHLAWKLPPTLKEPKIVKMCKTTLYGVCASLLSAVLLMNFNKNSLSCICEPPSFLVNALQGIVGKIFCICNAETNVTTHSAYKRSVLDGAEDKVYVGDVSCQDDVDKWKLISLAVDRVLFVIFVITFLVTTAQ